MPFVIHNQQCQSIGGQSSIMHKYNTVLSINFHTFLLCQWNTAATRTNWIWFTARTMNRCKTLHNINNADRMPANITCSKDFNFHTSELNLQAKNKSTRKQSTSVYPRCPDDLISSRICSLRFIRSSSNPSIYTSRQSRVSHNETSSDELSVTMGNSIMDRRQHYTKSSIGWIYLRVLSTSLVWWCTGVWTDGHLAIVVYSLPTWTVSLCLAVDWALSALRHSTMLAWQLELAARWT